MNKLTAAVGLIALSGFGQGALADSGKVVICHNSVQTAAVPASAVQGHRQHGDTLGACGSTMAAVVMMRCEPQDGALNVVAVSSSPAPAINGGIKTTDDCAVVLAELLDANYELRSVTTGSAGDNALSLYVDYLLLRQVPATP